MADKKIVTLLNGDTSYEISFAFCLPGKYKNLSRPNLASKNTVIEISTAYWMQDITVSMGLYKFVFGKPYAETEVYYGTSITGVNMNKFPWFGTDFYEVQSFLAALNKIILDNHCNFYVDIPSFIEWEHALRCGEIESLILDDDNAFGDCAWYADNSDGKVHTSAQKPPNDWGLYDMYGNIYEYCYETQFSGDQDFYLDPPIANPLTRDVFPAMGGCYDSTAHHCRSIHFMGRNNEFIEPIGFRLISRELK